MDQTNLSVSELSLMEGGASYRALQHALGVRMSDPRTVIRFAIILAAVCWIPLLVLSARQGVALGGTVNQPFLHDFTPHVRFLFALPLLIIADVVVAPRFIKLGKYLVTSGLLAESCIPEFGSMVRSATRFRDSTVSEITIIVMAYVSSAFYIRRQLDAGVSSWLAINMHGTGHLTFAGWWYALVSIPIFQFFLFRWLLRQFNWMRLMYRLSRLDLQLTPTHPDRAGGLGFVGQAMPETAVIILAISSVLCAAIATQVTYRGLLLQQFTYSYGIFVVIVMVVFVGPFLVFTPQLIAVKRRALMDYGGEGIRLGQAFHRKWLDSGANEEPISANDISSIVGFERTYALVRGMKIFPLEFADLRGIIIAVVLPVLPFVGTHIPLENALKVLPKILV